MPASPESASSEARPESPAAPRLLLVSVSWLGDVIMALPAFAAFRRRVPHARVTVLSKPGVADLWRLVAGVDEVMPLVRGVHGMYRTVLNVRERSFDFAYVMPRSFRAAVIPFLAGVPGRRGLAGHCRDWMLTETVVPDGDMRSRHQSHEMALLLGVSGEPLGRPPFVTAPDECVARARRRLADTWQDRIGSLDAPRLAGFFPGAARGPSKQWPADRFVELGKRLLGKHACRILVLGARADREVCADVARRIGHGALNLAGETTLGQLAALLQHCRVVVSNDSGGMHLAAAVGTRVVGIFGMTDPARTAPPGEGHRLVLARGVVRSRDLPRDSEAARQAMASIPVDEVFDATAESLT